jgi:hypothetical protein
MGAPPLPRNHPRHLDHFSKPMVLGIHNVIVIPNSIEKLFIFIYIMVIVPAAFHISCTSHVSISFDIQFLCISFCEGPHQ